MLPAMIRRQIERLRRNSVRLHPYRAAAAPVLGLAIGVALGALILIEVR